MTAPEIMAITLAALASIALVMLGLRGLAGEARIGQRLSLLAETGQGGHGFDLGAFDRLIGGRDRVEIEADLKAAGYASPEAPRVFAAARIGGALCMGLAVALILWLGGRWQGNTRLLAVAATGAGYVGAKLVLKALAASRRRRTGNELPFALDLMMMMLESGVSLDQCFRTLAGPEGDAVPLTQRMMAALVEDVRHGMPYAQALDRWAQRMGVPGAHALAGLVSQSLFQGTELGTALREFAREFTDGRIARAREATGRKTTQMAVAMMVFMMPALFIVLCGPAVVAILAALSGVET